jgi:hypothetical protein
MRITVPLLVGLALLGGCADAGPTTPDAALSPDAAHAALSAAALQDRAALRAATAPFHRIEAADRAGWSTNFPEGCMEGPQGGMGFHFANFSTLGTLEVTRPQLLMYEPVRNGRMRLIGVEYLYPGLPTDTPPTLFGQPFHWNEQFAIWALHAWVWEHNPAGTFADWNPRVSCRYAGDATTMSH